MWMRGERQPCYLEKKHIQRAVKKYKSNKIWNREYSRAKGERERETKAKDGSQDMVSEYRFYVSDNCYFSANAARWSNFVKADGWHGPGIDELANWISVDNVINFCS